MISPYPVAPARSTMPEIPVIEMVRPLPGFADHDRFALVQLDDAGILCDLRSLDDPAVRFLVVPPWSFFPDYAPEIDDETVEALRVTSPDEVLVLLVLNAGESLSTTTANLLAPVVVNTTTRRACQVILEAQDLPLQAVLAG